MKAAEILLEYSKEKTAQNYGKKIIDRFLNYPFDDHINNSMLDYIHTLIHSRGKEEREQEIERSGPKVISTIIDIIASKDPTPHKEYTQWLVRLYANGGLRIEDINRHEFLNTYDLGKKRKLIPSEYKDINQFKSYRSFENVISGLESKIKSESQVALPKGKAEVLYNDSEVKIIHPEDTAAACYYGQGTRWCTAATKGDNYFNEYNEDGPIYILLPTSPRYPGEKYQLHVPSRQFMNEKDNGVSLDTLFKRFPGLSAFLISNESEIADMIMFAKPERLEAAKSLIEKMIVNNLEGDIEETEGDLKRYPDNEVVKQDLKDQKELLHFIKSLFSYHITPKSIMYNAVTEFSDEESVSLIPDVITNMILMYSNRRFSSDDSSEDADRKKRMIFRLVNWIDGRMIGLNSKGEWQVS